MRSYKARGTRGNIEEDIERYPPIDVTDETLRESARIEKKVKNRVRNVMKLVESVEFKNDVPAVPIVEVLESMVKTPPPEPVRVARSSELSERLKYQKPADVPRVKRELINREKRRKKKHVQQEEEEKTIGQTETIDYIALDAQREQTRYEKALEDLVWFVIYNEKVLSDLPYHDAEHERLNKVCEATADYFRNALAKKITRLYMTRWFKKRLGIKVKDSGKERKKKMRNTRFESMKDYMVNRLMQNLIAGRISSYLWRELRMYWRDIKRKSKEKKKNEANIYQKYLGDRQFKAYKIARRCAIVEQRRIMIRNALAYRRKRRITTLARKRIISQEEQEMFRNLMNKKRSQHTSNLFRFQPYDERKVNLELAMTLDKNDPRVKELERRFERRKTLVLLDEMAKMKKKVTLKINMRRLDMTLLQARKQAGFGDKRSAVLPTESERIARLKADLAKGLYKKKSKVKKQRSAKSRKSQRKVRTVIKLRKSGKFKKTSVHRKRNPRFFGMEKKDKDNRDPVKRVLSLWKDIDQIKARHEVLKPAYRKISLASSLENEKKFLAEAMLKLKSKKVPGRENLPPIKSQTSKAHDRLDAVKWTFVPKRQDLPDLPNIPQDMAKPPEKRNLFEELLKKRPVRKEKQYVDRYSSMHSEKLTQTSNHMVETVTSTVDFEVDEDGIYDLGQKSVVGADGQSLKEYEKVRKSRKEVVESKKEDEKLRKTGAKESRTFNTYDPALHRAKLLVKYLKVKGVLSHRAVAKFMGVDGLKPKKKLLYFRRVTKPIVGGMEKRMRKRHMFKRLRDFSPMEKKKIEFYRKRGELRKKLHINVPRDQHFKIDNILAGNLAVHSRRKFPLLDDSNIRWEVLKVKKSMRRYSVPWSHYKVIKPSAKELNRLYHLVLYGFDVTPRIPDTKMKACQQACFTKEAIKFCSDFLKRSENVRKDRINRPARAVNLETEQFGKVGSSNFQHDDLLAPSHKSLLSLVKAQSRARSIGGLTSSRFTSYWDLRYEVEVQDLPKLPPNVPSMFYLREEEKTKSGDIKKINIVIKESETMDLFCLLTTIFSKENDVMLLKKPKTDDNLPQSDNRATQIVTPAMSPKRIQVDAPVRANASCFVSELEIFDMKEKNQKKSIKPVEALKDVEKKEELDFDAVEMHPNHPLLVIGSADFIKSQNLVLKILSSNIYSKKQMQFAKNSVDPLAEQMTISYRTTRLFTFKDYRIQLSQMEVSSMSVNSDIGNIIAVGYKKKDLCIHDRGIVLLWNVKHVNEPEKIYKFSRSVTYLEFSNPSTLSLATSGGYVAVINVCEEDYPVVVNTEGRPYSGHLPIWQFSWFKDESNGMYPVSCGADGNMYRYRTDATFGEKVFLSVSPRDGNIKGIDVKFSITRVSTLRERPEITTFAQHPVNSHVYLVGTSDGCVHQCSVMFTTHKDIFLAQHGRLNAIKFHPCCSHIYLTVGGDFFVRVWAYGIFEPLICLSARSLYAEDACFSAVWPEIMVTISGEYVDVWNIRRKVDLPVQTWSNPKSFKNTCICFSNDGYSVFVGDEGGYVHAYRLRHMPCEAMLKEEVLSDAIKRSIAGNKKLLASLDKLGYPFSEDSIYEDLRDKDSGSKRGTDKMFSRGARMSRILHRKSMFSESISRKSSIGKPLSRRASSFGPTPGL